MPLFRTATVRESVFLLLTPLCAMAQVQLTVPGSTFKAADQITVKIKNAGATEISYCVETGRPPFIEQRKSASKQEPNHSEGIKTLSVLEPGETREFPFQPKESGDIRLVLDYWLGSHDVNCKHPPKGKKQARSEIFTVQ